MSKCNEHLGRETNNKTIKTPSFLDALKLLCFPEYHLVDTYPTLCQLYSIAAAIPISSATAERSFLALKRVKTRIRSTMVQERLESLLLVEIERKVLLSIDKDKITLLGKTSPTLTKAFM